MPTNLPPEYLRIEKLLRDAQSTAEKLKLLEQLIRAVPKHKGTDRLRGELRRKISKLKLSPPAKKGVARKESSYAIGKEGAGQVVLVGAPNVGKSSLVAALTHATPEISPAPFSTWSPTPGMMETEDVQIQLVDLPPINRDYMDKGYFDLVRRSDLILLMVDVQSDPFQQFTEAIAILGDNRIVRAGFKYPDEQEFRMTRVPLQVIANKADSSAFDENTEIVSELLDGNWPLIAISAKYNRNLADLKSVIFRRLEIIRVYAKTPGKPADRTAPFILKWGDTVEHFAAKVHRDLALNMDHARIWGMQVQAGQVVQRDHKLSDGDVVEIHL